MPISKHAIPLMMSAALSGVLSACASGTPTAETAIGVSHSTDVATQSSCTNAEPGSAPTALPRYVSVHVANNVARVEGKPFAADALQARLEREASNPENQGAALLFASGTPADEARPWIMRVLHAGFSHVVISGVTASVGASVDAKASAPPYAEPEAAIPATAAPAQTPPEPNPTPPPATVSANPAAVDPTRAHIEVKQMGLHIGGGPTNDAEIARYAQPIAKRFGDFHACYGLAKGTRKAASFGVDLLVSSRGGRAKIKDFRTVLTGKDFLGCMLDVFGSIEFAGPERDTVVSYSLLFKPQSK